MVIKRDPARPVAARAEELRGAVVKAAEEGLKPPGSQEPTEPSGAVTVPEQASPVIPSAGVDREAAMADLGAKLGLDPDQSGASGAGTGVAGAVAGANPAASSFIANATAGLSGSKLSNLMGRNGPDTVDLQAEMDQNPATEPAGHQTTREALRGQATASLIFEDPAQHRSITEQGSAGVAEDKGQSLSDRVREWAWNTAKGISDRGTGSSVTNPQAVFDDEEGLRMRGTGEWANQQNPAFHAVAGLLASNLQRGQAEIDAASKGNAPSTGPAGPVVEVRNNNIHTVHPDGSRTTTFGSDGTEVTKMPDGTIIIRRTDGSTTTQTPDGAITETPPKAGGQSQPIDEHEDHLANLPRFFGGGIEQQLAAKRAAGSGDVDPADDGVDLDFGAGDDPRGSKDDLLGGDRRADDIRGTGSGGSMPAVLRDHLGAIDFGPDAVTGGGAGPDQDRISGTLLGQGPTLSISDAQRSDTDEADDTDDGSDA